MFRLAPFALAFVCLTAATTAAFDAEIENKNVDRTIDIASQNVKISYKITLEHRGKKPITGYAFALSAKEREHLAYISVRDAAKKELKTTETKLPNGAAFTFALTGSAPNPVVYVETVLTKHLEPYPAEITQAERQLVRYFGSAYFFSPYRTATQKTTVLLASRNVESFTAHKPSSHADTTITYGPYDNVEPFAEQEIVVHYENHAPFLTVTRLERTIEVSHWGNIAVEETLEVVHAGARLKGSFSRYDYQKDTRSSQPSVKSYKTILPASASGVYYRDTNGNISTSAMRSLKDAVELDLRPRFPLFGGWRTFYKLGYNVPSFEYLFHAGDQYLLKMRVIDHVFDDMAVDELVTRIILPEGASNVKWVMPYPVVRHPDTLHYTYLDTFGRPVVTISKKNLVENHINDFNLKYTFPKVMLLQEPLLVVGFLFILFLLVIIWVRLDFSLIKERELQQQHHHHHKD